MYRKMRTTAGEKMIDLAVNKIKKEYLSSLDQVNELNNYRKENLSHFLAKRMGIWNKNKTIGGKRGTVLWDPICKGIFLEEELSKVFLQPIYQRLNDISQLSFSLFYYPSATHTRLSHSLGVAYNVEYILKLLFKKNKITMNVSEQNNLILVAKLAALLHDVGHGPFGHALDKYAGLILEPKTFLFDGVSHFRVKPDKYISIYYIKKYLDKIIQDLNFNVSVDKIQALLNPIKKQTLTGYDRFVSDLIDSTIDADRMDYLQRDVHMTGLTDALIAPEFLIDAIVPYRGIRSEGYTLDYNKNGLAQIEQFLNARHIMYSKCYDADLKVAAEGMLIRAVEDLIEHYKPHVKLEDILTLTDGQLLNLLIDMTDPSMLSHKFATMLSQRIVFDPILEIDISGNTPINNKEIELYVDGLADFSSDDDPYAVYFGRLDTWSQLIGGKEHKEKLLIVGPYPEGIGAPRYVSNEIFDDADNSSKPMIESCPDIKKKLEEWEKDRYKIRVFVNPELAPGEKSDIVSRTKSRLGQKNY